MHIIQKLCLDFSIVLQSGIIEFEIGVRCATGYKIDSILFIMLMQVASEIIMRSNQQKHQITNCLWKEKQGPEITQ